MEKNNNYEYKSYEEMIMGQFNEKSKKDDESLKLSRKIYEILYPYKSKILEKKVTKSLDFTPTKIGKIELLLNGKQDNLYINILENLSKINNSNGKIVLDIGGYIYKFNMKLKEFSDTTSDHKAEDQQAYILIDSINQIEILNKEKKWDNYEFKNLINLEIIKKFINFNILNNNKLLLN